MPDLPAISVVIPNYNCSAFIERTIKSVLDQNYPKLDLILADGGSTDGSLEIAERYRDAFSHIISEPDTGQANALNKGFAKATGEVMGWINSDDMLMPGGLSLVGSLFALNTDVDWVTGRMTCLDEDDNIVTNICPKPISRARLLAGDYQWVQQESTYWRRSLWDKSGGHLDESLSLAVDGELWLRFSRYANLTSVRAQIGAFRFRNGQRSESMQAYHAEMLSAIVREHQLEHSTDDVIQAILATPAAVRTRSEAEGRFPGLAEKDPEPINRLKLMKHAVLRRLYGL
ncbi:glycosyltransferase family 2 protein [Ruegeria arenilitoris]|uniref:glycosyltransferase family 2 protein n=1 Tax=Ruegeria arenilitoris TaxID=1173585 RepID=UPI00147F1180|nr:glycosyltransferase family 2 protein [Ruegeria arenilitoris]